MPCDLSGKGKVHFEKIIIILLNIYRPPMKLRVSNVFTGCPQDGEVDMPGPTFWRRISSESFYSLGSHFNTELSSTEPYRIVALFVQTK